MFEKGELMVAEKKDKCITRTVSIKRSQDDWITQTQYPFSERVRAFLDREMKKK
jgi:hypothetical protein